MERKRRSPRLPRGDMATERLPTEGTISTSAAEEYNSDDPIRMNNNSNSVNLTVGQFIALKRRELHWSQFELAAASGVSRTEIGRVERDECDPSVKTIEGIEAALGLELYDLFMEQRRVRAKRNMKPRQPISKELAKRFVRLGITGDELTLVLDETKKTVDNLIKKKP